MNDISKGRSPSAASRIARGVGAAALSAVLIAGLAGCMTGKVASSAPVVQRNAVAPAGVDLGQPADRIAEQLERGAAPSARGAGPTASPRRPSSKLATAGRRRRTPTRG